jgi:propionyl-CoA carboxylase alpha chain/3-methylcrotonyl-CoA carboxylase alpha subunit/acetyl-CoA/propionyl-CoA carboxylase biotin carboxyl carrier protein
VQVVGDGAGNVIHLGERECSIQRRFQKIVEEAPSAGLPEALRREMIDAAVRLARAARYENAGTVELILAPSGEFYFLEMNTRLQVEHRVTEMICNIDLVALQLSIAAGEPLPPQTSIRFAGHAIECRVCAEDAERDFMPEVGRILRLAEPRAAWTRFDSGMVEGQVVGTSFDPMLAKLVVSGASRAEAIDRMTEALSGTAILGVVTNLDYLGRIMAHPAFREGRLHTGFVAEHAAALRAPAVDDQDRIDVLLAAAMAHPEVRRLVDDVGDPHAAMGPWRN